MSEIPLTFAVEAREKHTTTFPIAQPQNANS
jgi:hypothetical protein